jgi:hypothetical protein
MVNANNLTFEQHSALVLRARREFFEEQDKMFEERMQQQAEARGEDYSPPAATTAPPRGL